MFACYNTTRPGKQIMDFRYDEDVYRIVYGTGKIICPFLRNDNHNVEKI